MRNRFRTRKERIMFSVGVMLSTFCPLLATFKQNIIPTHVRLVFALAGVTLLISVLIIQRKNGYGRCWRKQNDEYLDNVSIDKQTPRM